MNPKFRAMILGDELTPLSQLSSAFLAPKTALHLQFAYYESALAVAFLVEKAGLPALQGACSTTSARDPDQRDPAASDENVASSIRRRLCAVCARAGEERGAGCDLGGARSARDGRFDGDRRLVEKHPKSFWAGGAWRPGS